MNNWQKIVIKKMKDSKVSQEKLAEMIGSSQSGLNHWLNGRREPTSKDLAKILNVLNIDSITLRNDGSYFEENAEFASIKTEGLVKVIGEAVMGTDCDLFMVEDLTGWLRIYSADPKAFALKVRGDSMYPRINSGEFVVIEPSTQYCAGDEVFVRTHDGRNMIKVLDYMREDQCKFSSINHEHKPFTLPRLDVDKVSFVAAIVKHTRYIPLEAISES